MNISQTERSRGGANASGTLALTPGSWVVRAAERPQALSTDYSLTRRALGLAVGSLLLAGC